MDYDVKKDYVMWWYEDHESKEIVEVYESTLSFMKKLIRHIPDKRFKSVRYIGDYATKKKNFQNRLKNGIIFT